MSKKTAQARARALKQLLSVSVIFLFVVGIVTASYFTRQEQNLDTTDVDAATCTNQLGRASSFNVYVLGNASQYSTDVESKVAVGGNANFTDYSVGAGAPSGAGDVLIVGGSINYNRGTVHTGNAVYGTTGTFNNVNFTNGTSRKDSPINFGNANNQIKLISSSLATKRANGVKSYQNSILSLSGNASGVNVFKVPGSELNSASQIVISAPAGSTVLVNVGGGNHQFTNKGIIVNGTNSSMVLWNFYESTKLTIDGIGVEGTILAPLAATEFNNSHINGNLIVGTLNGNGESHKNLFRGCPEAPTSTPQATPSPAPITCTTFDAGTSGTVRPVDNMQVTTQYRSSFGLSFRNQPNPNNPLCETGPKLAKTGAPQTAFEGDQGMGPDNLIPGYTFAPWFLTDDGIDNPGDDPCALVVNIAAGYVGKTVYFDVLDIDEREKYDITAFNAGGTRVASQRLAPTNDAGNSRPTRVTLRGSDKISRIVIKPDTSQKQVNWGIGFDNFCVYR